MRPRYLLLLLFSSLFLTACSLPGGAPGKVSLSYWGLFEGEDVFKPLLNDYVSGHSNVTVEYTQKSYSTLASYKETVLTRLKEGKAGDIVRIHSTWVKELSPYLAPLPSKVMTKEEYSNTFYPVAREATTVNGEIYGLPLHYDGLLLLANKKLLDESGVPFPKTWDEFRDVASKLTRVEGEAKKITRAGAAIGVSSNIPHAADILSLMFLQAGLKIPDDLTSQQAVDALTFYTNFFKVDKVWDESFPSSLVAFGRGQVVFVFAPSWRILEIKASNPGLEIVAGPPPQVPLEGNTSGDIQLASFWLEAVAKSAKSVETAYGLLKFLTSEASQKKLYALESSKRLFGEAYGRKDLASTLNGEPYLGPLLGSAGKAKLSLAVDASGNDLTIEIINRAIADNARGAEAKLVLENAKKSFQQPGAKPSPSDKN